jgi:hypothetical protein
VFLEDAVSVFGDVIAFAALALNQITGSSIPPGRGPPGGRRAAMLLASPSHSGQLRRREYEPFSSGTPV